MQTAVHRLVGVRRHRICRSEHGVPSPYRAAGCKESSKGHEMAMFLLFYVTWDKHFPFPGLEEAQEKSASDVIGEHDTRARLTPWARPSTPRSFALRWAGSADVAHQGGSDTHLRKPS